MMDAILALVTAISFVAHHCTADLIPVACTENFNSFKFCDTSLSIDDRVHALISLLTLEEKATLLTARESPLNFIPRLGIPEYDWGANCIHSAQSRCGTKCATVFPEPNALGATFNRTLISNISFAIALELRSLWLQGEGEAHNSNLPHLGLDCWSPTINIARDPRWGRMYEIPSEDPLWNGIYGKYYTLGLQNGSKDSPYYDARYYLVIATLKHFDAYSLENNSATGTTRHNFNAELSPYMLFDTYLPAWQTSIVEGGAKGVMCSYNAVNGVPTCANEYLLNDVLRGEWAYGGYVTSDSGAINDIYKSHHYTETLSGAVLSALNATCDIDSGGGVLGMGGDWGSSSPYQDNIPQLVNNGTMNVALVDRALFNTLRLRFELGLFDGNYDEQPYFKIPPEIVNNEQHQELNLFAAQSTQTLLKNEGNILPFAANAGKKVAVIGPHYNASADLLLENAYTGQVCYDSTFDCVPGVLQSIVRYVDASDLQYSAGCNGVWCTSTAGFDAAVATAKAADYVILMMGIDLSVERESHDRVNISLPGYQQLLASRICELGIPTVLVLVSGGIIAIDELKQECPAILYAFYPGFRGADAITDVIFGAFNPGGKLAVSMYWSNFTRQSDYLEMDLTIGLGKTYKYWRGTAPLYPFGYGLSYTQFALSANDTCTAPMYCVNVKNVGDRAGYETVFLFVYPPCNISSNESASKMIKKLIEFEKFALQAGESVTFAHNLDKTKDLALVANDGKATMFGGNYTLEFSNGVDQSVRNYISVY